MRSRVNLDIKSTQNDPNGLINKVGQCNNRQVSKLIFSQCCSIEMSKFKVVLGHMRDSCAISKFN